jgi:putative glutamine amidotransferase
MKPVIGINGDVRTDPELSVRVKMDYIEAVERAGGIPIVLPPASPEDAAVLLERVDALVLTGGGDIDLRSLGIGLHRSVELMHPRRQRFDWALTQLAMERDVPTLGICLGMQMMAAVGGGAIHQHLPDAPIEGVLDHRAGHAVEVVPASRLSSFVKNLRFTVVSHHHQGVSAVPRGFDIVAHAPDGVIEGMERKTSRFMVGVQWHPERDAGSPETQALFRALVEVAGSGR